MWLARRKACTAAPMEGQQRCVPASQTPASILGRRCGGGWGAVHGQAGARARGAWTEHGRLAWKRSTGESCRGALRPSRERMATEAAAQAGGGGGAAGRGKRHMEPWGELQGCPQAQQGEDGHWGSWS